MNSAPKVFRAVLAGISIVLAGCGTSYEPKGNIAVKQSSPEQVANSYTIAMRTKDWERAFACATPAWQNALVKNALFDAAITAGFTKEASVLRSLADLAQKHGLDIKQLEIARLAGDDITTSVKAVAQKPAFYGDLISFMGGLEAAIEPNPAEPMATASFSDFKVDGATATAKVTFEFPESHFRGEPATWYFVRIDKKWYVDCSR